MDGASTTPPPEETQYEHKSGFGYATRVGVQAGGVGTLMACLQRISGPPLMPPGSTFWSIAGHNAGFFGMFYQCQEFSRTDCIFCVGCSCNGGNFRFDRNGSCKSTPKERSSERGSRWLCGWILGRYSRCVNPTIPVVISVFTFVILARSLPMAAAGCAAVGVAVGGFDYSGQLASQTASPEMREERRKRFFKQPRPQPTELTE